MQTFSLFLCLVNSLLKLTTMFLSMVLYSRKSEGGCCFKENCGLHSIIIYTARLSFLGRLWERGYSRTSPLTADHLSWPKGKACCIRSQQLLRRTVHFCPIAEFLHVIDTSHLGPWTNIFVPLVMQKHPTSQDNFGGCLIDSIYIWLCKTV